MQMQCRQKRTCFVFQTPETKRPHIVSGANKRTESNVSFGEPELAGAFYETTTDKTFQPVSIPYTYKRSDDNTRSTVPLSYYGKKDEWWQISKYNVIYIA